MANYLKPSLTAAFIVIGIASCSVVESYVDDDFNNPDPPPLAYRKVFPAVAEFTIQQKIFSSIKIPPDSFFNKVIVAKYPTTQQQRLRFLTRIYNKGSWSSDDLLLFEINDVVDDVDTIALGGTMKKVLDDTNIEIKMLEVGATTSGQPTSRGYYTGTFLLTLNSVPVSVGSVTGYVAYDGEFRFEFKDPGYFRFMSGRGIDISEDAFLFTASVVTVEKDSIATTTDTLQVSIPNAKLTAALPLQSTSYDTLIINLARQP
jgi:hypothetical protein